MLQADKLCAGYGDVQVLHDVSFEVKKGQTVALIGANGAGKTTVLRAISGIIRPKSGEIRFNDANLHLLPPHKLVDLGIAHVPEGRRLFPEMTVEENLFLGALRIKSKTERLELIGRMNEIFPILKERKNQAAGTLSGGEQQMLAIARALMSQPQLLILDEPSLGLAPILVQSIFSVIRRIKEEGVTILLIEQNVRTSLTISDYAFLLENGRITMHGTGAELLQNPQIKEAYLGI